MTDSEILTEFDSYGNTFLDLDEAKLIKSRRRKLAEEYNSRHEDDGDGFRTGQRSTRVLVP